MSLSPRAALQITSSITVDGKTQLVLAGLIDETCDLGFLRTLVGQVVLHAGEVNRLTSFGVRRWRDAVKAMPPTCQVEMQDASPALADHIRLVAGFLGPIRLRSFFAVATCQRCEAATSLLVNVEAYRASTKLPTRACSCGGVFQCVDPQPYFDMILRAAATADRAAGRTTAP